MLGTRYDTGLGDTGPKIVAYDYSVGVDVSHWKTTVNPAKVSIAWPVGGGYYSCIQTLAKWRWRGPGSEAATRARWKIPLVEQTPSELRAGPRGKIKVPSLHTFDGGTYSPRGLLQYNFGRLGKRSACLLTKRGLWLWVVVGPAWPFVPCKSQPHRVNMYKPHLRDSFLSR